MKATAINEQAANLQRVLNIRYGLSGLLTELDGEVDQNFKMVVPNGKKYTIKISPADTDPAALDFQISLLEHLAAKDLHLDLPMVTKARNGEMVCDLEGKWLRVYEWVDGRMLSQVNPRSDRLLESWGSTAAQLVKSLQDFDHPYAHRVYKWDPSKALHARRHLTHIEPSYRPLANYFWDLFEEQAVPRLPFLRMGVNYNDAHEHNLLVNGEPPYDAVTGVIDFGDAVYTHTINEAAIACAYAMMYFPDPLAAAMKVVAGFHQTMALTQEELEVLYPLIGARLMLTVAIAAHNRSIDPDQQYLTISEQPAWDLLEKMKTISPQLAHFHFRSVCNLKACPKQSWFDEWVQKAEVSPVIQTKGRELVQLDLSIGSLELGLEQSYHNQAALQNKITEMVGELTHNLGVGGYNEVRPFYSTEAYRVSGNHGAKWRTVHLGLDIWDSANVAVYAPLNGMVHAVSNNVGERNYGPTIILRHNIDHETHFYTLYGHLSVASLDLVEVNQMVQAGDQIGTLGAAPENGNWPPHLHFQIILDLLDFHDDFPGVAFPNERNTWLSICPNPTLLFPGLAPVPVRRDADEILQLRKKYLGHNLSISYRSPLHIVRGAGQFLFDANGRRYLDTVNNVPHVGHQHPRIVTAAQKQLAVLNTNTRYLHDNIVQYAESLLKTFPPELCVVYFVNSGSEANELAMRLVKNHTQSEEMIAVEVGYHGNTQHCVGISSYKFDGTGGQGAPPSTHVVPIPDTYRGMYRDEDAGQNYAAFVEEKLQMLGQSGKQIAGFICESIMSCGGQIVLPSNYLKHAYAAVRAAGGLCIADEVQVGFGRVGEAFWGFELQGVTPDVVTLGKPIGNGHPLGAVITTRDIAQTFDNGMEYFNTFGGNPVSCAIGLEVLNVIKEEKLQEQTHLMGQYLLKELHHLQTRYPIIGDVRGKGLFLGIELVRDQQLLEPADLEADYLINRMRQRGILMSTDGPYHNVIKIKPPLCFNRKDADFLIENLELVLSENALAIK